MDISSRNRNDLDRVGISYLLLPFVVIERTKPRNHFHIAGGHWIKLLGAQLVRPDWNGVIGILKGGRIYLYKYVRKDGSR